MDDLEDNYQYRILSKQSGALVDYVGPGMVWKKGHRVTRNEEAALRFVKEHSEVPVPEVFLTNYFTKDGLEIGSLLMELVDGTPLDSLWDIFSDDSKERICYNIWEIVRCLQQLPRPPSFTKLHQCGADGSLTHDVLLKDLNNSGSPISTKEELRARINERYLHHNGGSYLENLLNMLPHSSTSVFTYGDLCPRNIMVNNAGQITGIIDWENAGWYPDYWEYANMLKPSKDEDWMRWMDRTKPVAWDITGINKARRVLF